MQILKTLKPIRMNGKIIEAGQTVKVSDDQSLIAKGYARMLTKEETREILNDYVQYARAVFMEEPELKAKAKNKTAIQGNLL